MKKRKIYEGKAKKLFETDEQDQLIQEFKDDATALDGLKKGTIKGKGSINNQISSQLFMFLESYHVPTHFVKQVTANSMQVKKCDMIPVEVIVRNIAAGSIVKRSDYKEGDEIVPPMIEFNLKDDEQHDPLINAEDILQDGLANQDELETIRRLTVKINAILRGFFNRRGIKLVDFKLEFGRYRDHVVLADEISPDTCRFWDASTGDKLDKDRFRKDLGNVEEAYNEMLNRVLNR